MNDEGSGRGLTGSSFLAKHGQTDKVHNTLFQGWDLNPEHPQCHPTVSLYFNLAYPVVFVYITTQLALTINTHDYTFRPLSGHLHVIKIHKT